MIEFLTETLRAKRALFISATSMTVLLKIASILPSVLLGKIIDSMTAREGVDTSYVYLLVSMLCAVTVLQSVVNPLQTYQLVRLVQTTLKDKSIYWTDTILRKDFEQFSELRLGGLIKSLERGINAHEKFLTFVITSGFPLMIEVFLIAGIFSYIGGTVPLLITTLFSAGYLCLYHYLVNWRRPFLLAVNEQEDLVSSKLFETFHAAKCIKLERACDSAPQPLYAHYKGYARAATQVAGTGAILGSVKILYLGLTVATLLAWGVHDQLSPAPRLTTGELIAVFSIAGMLVNNIGALAEAYRTLDQFLVDKKTLEKALSLDALTVSDGKSSWDSLSRVDLSILPSVTDRPLSFYIEQSVAIIGPSGGGKTTLLEVLAGTATSGRYHLSADGSKVGSSELENYLRSVRYCPQHPAFLAGSFQCSVLFGQDISPSIKPATDALMLGDIVKNRTIAEGARNISGGEAKRLSLLRLINKPGDFNLFDEPTASLDKEMGSRVWEVIFSSFNRRGLICATHDVAVLPRFDRVIVIKHGAVIADGHWSKLSSEPGVVRALQEITLASPG
ncbi:ABC transporter ATP-binding protein [Pseudomonas sp. v388]|uniref:ATP-binding cassette domain-containing protein n=1 Tax=Pseudomonas sp. v388 TaxID=2479849 RepID=UPI000F7B2D9F|nr:ABC transporter ATP-binding protein [Pseudomonas sp. v388]RRV04846.1 ABC transporter ATP-binding protein [Pseudomonas sp. v388]